MAATATADAVVPAAREGLVAIRTRALEKRYAGVVAVRPLDLEVRAGEVFGLLGPNGAGKTTTILMLLGLTEPTGGEARVLGLDPARNPLKVKRHVGYLPDNVGFYGDLSGTPEPALYRPAQRHRRADRRRAHHATARPRGTRRRSGRACRHVLARDAPAARARRRPGEGSARADPR
jgi:ABC-type branched-subunit amino acid transport system ATPase component